MSQELSSQERLKILRLTDEERRWYTVDDKRLCLICERIISGREIRIEGGPEKFSLACPTDGCPGTYSHWFLYRPAAGSAGGAGEGWRGRDRFHVRFPAAGRAGIVAGMAPPAGDGYAAGKTQLTSAPLPSADFTVSSAPMTSARYFMMCRPMPRRALVEANPLPLSLIESFRVLAFTHELDRDGGGLAVLERVGDGFLGDAVEVEGDGFVADADLARDNRSGR